MSVLSGHTTQAAAGTSSLYGDQSLKSEPMEIRLLQVDASEDSDAPITCRLETFELSSAPAYRCVSYVWGDTDPDEETTLLVNGIRVKGTINLLRFLYRIRAKSKPGAYYWVDALSINQTNDIEKSAHVATMGRIYQRAELVIGWLGWEFDRTGSGSKELYPDLIEDDTGGTYHRGILFLRQLAEAFRKWTKNGGNPWPPSTQLSRFNFGEQGMYDLLGIEPQPFCTWESLSWLLSRAWFRRAWIVQEASLAKNLVIVCGFRDIYWDDFVQVSIFLHASGWFHIMMRITHGLGSVMIPAGWQVLLFATLQNMAGQIRTKDNLGDIFNIHSLIPFNGVTDAADVLQFFVIMVLRFRASDLRDKLYAPRALVSAAYPKLHLDVPAVDYTVDPDEVCLQHAGYLLEQSSSLDLLSYAGGPAELDKPMTGTPHSAGPKPLQASSNTQYSSGCKHPSRLSWMPDFTAELCNPLFGIPRVNYDPLPGKEKVSIWKRETNALEVEGACLTTIDRFGPPLADVYNSRDFRPLIKFAIGLNAAPSQLNPTDSIEALWRTLIGDCDGTSCPADPSTASGLKSYLEVATAVLHYGDQEKSDLVRTDDWTEWTCFDTLHNSNPAAANAIPSVSELNKFTERWRSMMIDSKRLPESRELGKTGMYGLAAGRVYHNRRLFVAQDGTLGMAPRSSREGDQIWLLAGARVPFVLRSVGVDDQRAVIGEAYVHGAMHGEILKRNDNPQFQRIQLA